MRGLIFASLALLPPFSGLWASAELPQSGRTWCQASGACYSIHLGRMNFYQAQNACAQHGGGLSTAIGRTEVGVILALLKGLASQTGGSLFWLGLVKKPQQCTLQDLPLRGFSWVSPGLHEPRANGTATPPNWLSEPNKSCTMQRCAGLQVSLGQPHLKPWGLKDHGCTKASPGYICKYSYAGTCPALHSGARGMVYRLPFQLQSPAVEFSPPGTELTIRCPGREERFTCRLSPNGSHWESSEQDLCSCPSGYWSPSSGDCAAFSDCFSAQGAFRCLCAWRSRLAADEESCVAPVRDGATTGKPAVSTPRATETSPANNTSGQNISFVESFPTPIGNSTIKHLAPSNPSNYIFILITVAVVILMIMVMVSLQVFQRCFKNCSSNSSQPTKEGAVVVEGDPEASATRTNSEHSLGPSKGESIASQDDFKPAELGQL